jgi:hypothetical protein
MGRLAGRALAALGQGGAGAPSQPAGHPPGCTQGSHSCSRLKGVPGWSMFATGARVTAPGRPGCSTHAWISGLLPAGPAVRLAQSGMSTLSQPAHSPVGWPSSTPRKRHILSGTAASVVAAIAATADRSFPGTYSFCISAITAARWSGVRRDMAFSFMLIARSRSACNFVLPLAPT